MGFDIECIPNIQSLAGEYFCPVCRLLICPNEALQSMCTHLYCKPCLAYVATTTKACPYDGYLVTETDAKPLAESNKVLYDTISRIFVHCLYKKSGCTWLGTLSESSSHCSGCSFGTSLVICNYCGIQIEHRQGQEHVQVCPGVHQAQVQESQTSHAVSASDQVQASAAVATSQINAQGQGLAAATMTQEQWYQQQYQQYYQNYFGYYMYQQNAPMSYSQQQVYPPSQALQTASQYQVPFVQPAVNPVAQIHSQVQAQQHQPHVVFPSAPQKTAASLPEAHPSVPPHSYDPSQIYPAFQDHQNLQAQAHSQPTSCSQVPQNQQFNGEIKSQLPIGNPMGPQAITAQNSLPQNTTGQGQSNQPHAYLTGREMYPQHNQTDQIGVNPNHMSMYPQVGTQPYQGQNYLPQKVPHVLPPQTLPTMQEQQSPLPSITSTEWARQLVHKYGKVQVSESSAMHPAQQPLSESSLPAQQQTTAPVTDVVHNQMYQGGPFLNPQLALQSLLYPKGLVQGLHMHQPITPSHGLQPQMKHHPATVLQGGSGQAALSSPDMNQAGMQKIQNQIPLNHTVGKQGDEAILNGTEARLNSDSTNTVNGVKHVEIAAASTIVACNKSGPKGKQEMKENAGNGVINPGKNPVLNVEDNSKKLFETLNKDKELCQLQTSRVIISGKNPPLVKDELLSFHQKLGAPSEEVPPGSQQRIHTPKDLPPDLRPHGHAAALPSERRLRAYANPHHEFEGPYDHFHPSQVSKVSISAPEQFALGLRDERFRTFADERLNPASLEPTGIRHLENGLKHDLRPSHIDNDLFLRSGASSSGSLDRGVGQRLPLRPHEKHVPDFDLRTTPRLSQPATDLGEGQFGHRLRSPTSELWGDRTAKIDIEGRCRFDFPRHMPSREFEGHGNLQMGESLRYSDMTGPGDVLRHVRGGEFSGQHGLPSLPRLKEVVDSNALRPGDPGFRSKYTLQGFPGDGGSFPGDMGPFPNPRKRALEADAWCHICKVDCKTLQGLDLHSQSKEHQQKSMGMVLMTRQNTKYLKSASSNSSPFSKSK